MSVKRQNTGPVFHDGRGSYILRKSFTARNGHVYCNRVYKIYIK